MTDRGPDGRFKKGASGNPAGRSPRATEAEYLDALKSTLPIDRFQRIVDQYARRAEKGDTRAAEVLFKYVLPQVQKVQHSGDDGGAIIIRLVGND